MTSSTYKELICPVGNNYCWPFDRADTNILDTGNYYFTPGIEIDKNIWGRWLFNVKKITTTRSRIDWIGTSTSVTTVYRANPELVSVYDEDGNEWVRIIGVWDKSLPPAITFAERYYSSNGTFLEKVTPNYPLFCYDWGDPYQDPADYSNEAFFPKLYISGGKFKASSRLIKYYGSNYTGSIASITPQAMTITMTDPNEGYWHPPSYDPPNWSPVVTYNITVTIDETFF